MKKIDKEQSSNTSLGFFFLTLYTFFILARPHEWTDPAIEFPIIRTLLIITFFLYLVMVKPKHMTMQGYALLGLLGIIFLSSIRNRLFYEAPALMLDFITASIIPFIIFIGFLDSHKKHMIIMKTMLFACLFMMYNAYTQVQSEFGYGWVADGIFRSDMEGMQTRYVGILNDPNDMGMYLVMCLPIAYYLMSQSQSFMAKVYYFSFFFLCSLNIYWTQSRGSILGALAVLGYFFYIRYGKVKTFLLGALSLPTVIFVLSKFRKISAEDESAASRVEAWYQGVLMFKYRPLVGVGKGQFLDHHYKVAHNSFVTIMSELGAIGYWLWAFFLISTFLLLQKIIGIDLKGVDEKIRDTIEREQNLALFMAVSLTGYLATAFFISRSFIIFLYIFVAMSLSIFLRMEKLGVTETIDKSSIIRSSMVWSFISLVFLYFIIRFLA